MTTQASFFKLSVSTTLAAHMIAAYTLFFFILLHGFLYVAWLPVFDSLSEVARRALPVLNPTYLYNETWPGLTSSLGIWRASLVFTGLAATVCFAFIFITTLPFIRNRQFNVFYFFHLLGVVGIVIVCLHASTMLYCVAPGLAMWLLDWGMRFYELRQKLAGSITSLGRGWYTITVPLPRHRLDGCACKSPLAHFYVYHAASSIRELHPFTTITHLATQNALTAPDDEEFPIQFLFRKSDKTVSSTKDLATFQDDDRPLIPRLFRKVKRPKMQWTNQVASLVDNHPSPNGTENTASAEALEKGIAIKQRLPSVDVGLRLEGPYFTPADPAHFNTTVCFVAGTGVSGAIAIAAAFSLQERISVLGSSGSQTPTMSRPPSRALKAALAIPDTLVPTLWKRCIVVWSVREDDVVDLPWLISEVEGSGLDLQIHLTGAGRPRLNLAMKLAEIRKNAGLSESTWVYLSGPGPFIAAGEKACKEAPLGVDGRPVEYYGARWGV